MYSICQLLSLKPYSQGISIIWGPVWFWNWISHLNFVWCILTGYAKPVILLEFTDLTPGYPDVKVLRVPYYCPIRWIKKKKKFCALCHLRHQVKIISQALCFIYLWHIKPFQFSLSANCSDMTAPKILSKSPTQLHPLRKMDKNAHGKQKP